MSYAVERNIVVPSGYVKNGSGFVPPFKQIHLHSTANPSAPLNNEVAYLSRNYPNGNYTHLVGENGRVIQVAEVGQGAWDVGGDWNAETYAAIEFGERVTSQADFDKSYKVYIELARDLAKQAGIPLILDTPDVAGIKTHNYVSRIGHGSDHTDPIAFLAKWGVRYDKLKYDIEHGFSDDKPNTGGQTPSNKKGAVKMACLVICKDNMGAPFLKDRVFYWSADAGFKYLEHPDDIKILDEISNHVIGKPMFRKDTSKGAPWHMRLAQVNGACDIK